MKQENICMWLNVKSVQQLKRIEEVFQHMEPKWLSSGLAAHVKTCCTRDVVDNVNCSGILVLASTIKLHDHCDDVQFYYPQISVFPDLAALSSFPAARGNGPAAEFAVPPPLCTLETTCLDHGTDLTQFQRCSLAAFDMLRF